MSSSPAFLSGSRVARYIQRQRLRGLGRRLSRLNHLLIPDKATERDKIRRRPWVRFLGLVGDFYYGFSREGRGLLFLSIPIGLASLNVRTAQVHLLWIMLLCALFFSWMSRPLFRLRSFRSQVRTPARVAVGQPAVFQIEIENRGTQALSNLRFVTPFLPWDGRFVHFPDGLAEVGVGRIQRVDAVATFQARGEHHLDPFRVGQLVSFGLSIGPLTDCQGARFLVVPPVAPVLSLTFERRVPDGHGAAISAQTHGEADIAGVRPYRIGDPLKHLHARTWARTGEPHIREYVDERDERIALLIILDDPDSSERSREAALSLAAGVAARLTLHGGGLDVLSLDGGIHLIEPRTSQPALDAVLDRLATHRAEGHDSASLLSSRDVLARATSAVLITAGDPALHEELVSQAESRNLALKWLRVVDGSESYAQAREDSVVNAADLESGKKLWF